MKFKNLGMFFSYAAQVVAISRANMKREILSESLFWPINNITPRRYQDRSKYQPHNGKRKALREQRKYAERFL